MLLTKQFLTLYPETRVQTMSIYKTEMLLLQTQPKMRPSEKPPRYIMFWEARLRLDFIQFHADL